MANPIDVDKRARWSLAAMACCAWLGCQGIIGDPGATPGGPGPGPGPGPGSRPPPTEPACAAADVRPASAPLRRLSAGDYTRAVGDLLPGVSVPAVMIAPDSHADGFDNNVAGQSISPLLIEQYDRAATQIADAARASLAAWLGCGASPDAACARRAALGWLARALRRALSEEERTAWGRLFDNEAAVGTPADAVHSVVWTALQAPDFLYRPELGDPAAPAPEGLTALTGAELATRLSFLLWRTTPDATLTDAATAGELATPEGLERHARRMLADDRARAAVDDFHAQWFELHRLETVRLDPAMFPQFTDAARAGLIDGTRAYFRRAFWEVGTLDALLTAPGAFVNDATAPLHGVPAPGSAAPVWTALPRAERAGALTLPGVLASTSHATVHSPIMRGVFVLDRMLCQRPPPPPPGANAMLTDTPMAQIRTTRQRIETAHSSGASCQGCHARIDGAGFAFEHYDAAGRYRTMENGAAVDASGQLVGTRDADGEFDGAVELASRLAGSRQVRECFATQWYRYALGRSETAADRCQVRALTDALDAARGDMRELLVQLVRSPAFRFRPTATP